MKSLNKILLACILVSPVTAVFAYDSQEVINRGHMETQRLVERQRQDAQRVQAIQAQRRDENQMRERENKRQMEKSRQQALNRKPVTEAEMKKGLKDLGDLITSDQAKDVMNYMNNLQPDPYEPTKVDPVNMDGFDTELKPQQSNFKYSFER